MLLQSLRNLYSGKIDKTLFNNEDDGFFTPRFPMCQIGVFRTLRKECARKVDCKKSWIVSKGRAAVSLS